MMAATASKMSTSVPLHPAKTERRVRIGWGITTACVETVTRVRSVSTTSTSARQIRVRTEGRVWIWRTSLFASVRPELPVFCAKRTRTTATWERAFTREYASTKLEDSNADVLTVHINPLTTWFICLQSQGQGHLICVTVFSGFVGPRCEGNVNECLSNPCNDMGAQSCVDLVNSYHCQCKPGWSGQRYSYINRVLF